MSDIVTPVQAPVEETPWWHRKLDPEQRQRIMRDLAIQKPHGWELRFGIMLGLSVVVAVMGLQLNSAAVVIGAMLLAPLMQPVLAAAGCLALGLLGKAGFSVARVIVATAGCVLIAFLLAAILPEQVGFTEEILSRTRPDSRDLIVALAAGAAGAYATVREDASASLPGVAVAVALVPPLGTLGITLEAGDFGKAWGSFLLYSTNLVAIVLVGVLVFVVTGFVPPQRLEANRARVVLSVLGMAALVSVVGWPLIQASRSAAEVSRNEATATEIVEAWLSETDSIDEVEVTDEVVRVSLRGTGQPPTDEDLKAALSAALAGRTPRVEWLRVGIPATTTTTISPNANYESEVRSAVEAWLSANVDGELSGFSLNGADLRIDLAGSGEPPSVDELSEQLSAQFGTDFSVRVNWSERVAVISGQQADPIEEIKQQMQLITETWAQDEDVAIDSFDVSGGDATQVSVEVRGQNEPNVSSLESQLNAYYQSVSADIAASSGASSVSSDDQTAGGTTDSEAVEVDLTVLFAEQVVIS